MPLPFPEHHWRRARMQAWQHDSTSLKSASRSFQKAQAAGQASQEDSMISSTPSRLSAISVWPTWQQTQRAQLHLLEPRAYHHRYGVLASVMIVMLTPEVHAGTEGHGSLSYWDSRDRWLSTAFAGAAGSGICTAHCHSLNLCTSAAVGRGQAETLEWQDSIDIATCISGQKGPELARASYTRVQVVQDRVKCAAIITILRAAASIVLLVGLPLEGQALGQLPVRCVMGEADGTSSDAVLLVVTILQNTEGLAQGASLQPGCEILIKVSQ